MGASHHQHILLWQQKGRSVLEYASPAFFSRLTQDQSKQIENCQKKAFSIILQDQFKNYENALTVLDQEKLSDRRLSAAMNFGENSANNPRHSDMFPRNEGSKETSRNWKPFKEYFCRTERYYRSSLPTIARMMNEKYLLMNESKE